VCVRGILEDRTSQRNCEKHQVWFSSGGARCPYRSSSGGAQRLYAGLSVRFGNIRLERVNTSVGIFGIVGPGNIVKSTAGDVHVFRMGEHSSFCDEEKGVRAVSTYINYTARRAEYSRPASLIDCGHLSTHPQHQQECHIT
jgi:hypothetical protein